MNMFLQFQGPVLVMKNQNYVENFFLQKIITLVLLTLTCNFQISQYDSNISRALCNPSLLSLVILLYIDAEQVELRETYWQSPAIIRSIIAFILMLINKVFMRALHIHFIEDLIKLSPHLVIHIFSPIFHFIIMIQI